MKTCKIEIIFAEFGETKFKPDVDRVKFFFPEARVTVVTEEDVVGPWSRGSERWGNRMNDYWKVRKLIESEADVAISMDADTWIVNENVRAIIPLAQRFGLCLPANPRGLVKVDTMVGADSDQVLDDTVGMGYAFNMTPIAVFKECWRAVHVLDMFCDRILSHPVRGPLAMWRACYEVQFFPCLLPPQWCVCAEDVGCGNEIILHIGHEKVRSHYGL